MLPLQIRIATAAALAIACVGCTDKDREMARRTSDGSDTFQFKPPESIAQSKSRPGSSEPAAPAAKPHPIPSKDSDGSETFRFKPDPRLSPKSTGTAGK